MVNRWKRNAFEFKYDEERYTRRLKRKRFDIKSFEFNVCDKTRRGGDESWDPEYRCFMNDELNYELREPVMEDVNSDLDEDEDDKEEEEVDDVKDFDPHYSMFFKNLKEDGKSYVLEVSGNDGVLDFLKYEADEGESDDECCDPQTWRKGSIGKEEVEIERDNYLKSDYPPARREGSLGKKGEKMETEDCLRSDYPPSQRRGCIGKEGEEIETEYYLGPTRRKGSLRKKREEIETEDYLGPTRRKGSLRKKREDIETEDYLGPTRRKGSLRKKREYIEAEDYLGPTRRKGSLRKKREDIETEHYFRNDPPAWRKGTLGKEGEETETEDYLRNAQTKDKLANSRSLRRSRENKRKFSVIKQCPKKKPILEVNDESESEQNSGTDIDHIIDGCYRIFLNNTIEEGGCPVFIANGRDRVEYERDDADNAESSSDSEILVWDDASYCEGKNNPFVPSKANASVEISHFRNKVMGILRNPYNDEEYESLLKAANAQISVERNLELRGRPISVPVGALGKSYLDHFEDFKETVDAVQHERPKVLNLLRGFFYWLEHLGNEGEGVFKPWLDPSCWAVLPGSR